MSTKDLITTIISVTSIAFAVFFFMDNRHTHPTDVVEVEAKFNRDLLMKESTRYAEVEKFYTDRLKDGETLSASELDRLDLVQRQQTRIAETLRTK